MKHIRNLASLLLFLSASTGQAGSVAKVSVFNQLPAVVCGFDRGSSVSVKKAMSDLQAELQRAASLANGHVVLSAPTVTYGGISEMEVSVCVTVSRS